MALEPVKIRKALFEDIPEMVSLLGELFSIEADFIFDEQVQTKGLALFLEDPDMRCIMVAAKKGEKVVGMATAQLLVSTAKGSLVALVEDVVVSAPYHGHEIGHQIMVALEQWVKRHGGKRLQLLADKENRTGIDFYEREDWSKTSLICLHKG